MINTESLTAFTLEVNLDQEVSTSANFLLEE